MKKHASWRRPKAYVRATRRLMARVAGAGYSPRRRRRPAASAHPVHPPVDNALPVDTEAQAVAMPQPALPQRRWRLIGGVVFLVLVLLVGFYIDGIKSAKSSKSAPLQPNTPGSLT